MMPIWGMPYHQSHMMTQPRIGGSKRYRDAAKAGRKANKRRRRG